MIPILTSRSYTKQRLTSLHPNIMVQRSPSHFQTGTFYWAHVNEYLSVACSHSDGALIPARKALRHRSSHRLHGRIGLVLRAVRTLQFDSYEAADSEIRWDTPQHVLTDDQEDVEGGAEIWPGKDYSNGRVQDFHTLSKPEEDMYDRTKVPRMPWCVCILPYLIDGPTSIGMTWGCKL